MRKMIISLILIFVLSCSFAEQPRNVEQSIRLSVTTTNTVYFGVSTKEQTSSIFPTGTVIPYEKGLGFKYNAKTMNWQTDSVYFFLISFVQQKIKMTITPPGPLVDSTKVYSVAWKNESSGISGLSSSSTAAITLVDETSLESVGYPRVYSFEMKLVIDGSSPLSANSYSGNIKVKVETTT